MPALAGALALQWLLAPAHNALLALALASIFCLAFGWLAASMTRLRSALAASQRLAQQVTESERRYRAIVENQSEMVSLATPTGRLTFVNTAYARHFGRAPEQMIGTSLFDYIPTDERAGVAARLRSLRGAGDVEIGENRMLAADGSGPRWVAWINRAVADSDGKLDCIHCVGRDITEQKALETQLFATAQEVEGLYNNAPCGYHSVGASGTYIKINATELGWLGCRADEVLGKLSPRDFFAADDQLLITRAFAAAKTTGQSQKVDCRLIGRHGIQRHVSINMSVVLDEDGTFLMTRSVMFDVSAQKDAERALQRLNREQRLVLESELFGIAKLQSRRFVWVNAGLTKLLGFDPGELHGVSVRICYLDDASYDTVGAIAYPIMAAGGTYRGELQMRRKDGRPIWVEATAMLLDAETRESLWMMKDTTARRHAELALRHSQSLLERTGAVAGVGGWEFDLQTRTLLWTDETCRIHGVPPGFKPELAQAIEFYTPESRPRIVAALEAAIDNGLAYDLELKIRKADGDETWVRTLGHVEIQDGHPVRLVGACQDVSAKVQQIAHIEDLYKLADQQRKELAVYRDNAEAEAEMAGFLLSNLSRVAQLDARKIQYFWQPAEAFSGDIIAVTESAAGDTYALLADATGHGLAAAINLIPLTSAFYAMAAKGFNLVTISEQLNKVVKEFSLADRFVAVTLARLQRRSLHLEVVNAGNPAALLVDGERKVLREFGSGSVPLGIVDRPLFRPHLETVELRGDESLVLFSDGLVEANDVDGKPFARAGVNHALQAADSSQTIARAIEQSLKIHAAGTAFADDVSVLVLPAANFSESRPAWEGESDPHAGALRDEPIAKEAHDTGAAGSWSVELRFSSSELKQLEAVPVIVELTRTFGLSRALDARLFTVLSELFQNALDHGLLGLDSQLKNGGEGFEYYLALRATRLAALEHGEVNVSLIHRRNPHGGGRLRIQINDTGPGFDHRMHVQAVSDHGASASGLMLSGRGIRLMLELCDSVEFNARGNQATVELAYI